VNAGRPPAPGEPISEEARNIAKAIGEISDRATQLVREEVELAKAEMSVKATRLARGAVVAVVAGVFFVTALLFVLIAGAWALYYYLPIGDDFTYFWGFLAMAVILVVLGAIAGLIAARAVKRGSPPVPNLAIEEARRIRDSVGPGPAPAIGGDGPAPHPADRAQGDG
jgi:Putative Actinobacterial Holin-X, holin superfamily III